ncbi:hypothetical protein [Spirulina sp. 06S082]|uniref:hypothetical protein n=1 Tax=Spirulina sp. 06S082 TaxID=3110248 RepID=UPI002B220C33|nr:hypothetical protein [Spirulina sp. 06S082]MEA5469331.1 hypothetical protein [Spirulina sp. 06S082]
MILLETHPLNNNTDTTIFNSSGTFSQPFHFIIDLNSLYKFPYRGFIYQVFNEEFTGNWQRLYTEKIHYPALDLGLPYRLGFKVYRGARELKIYRL